MRIFQLAGDRNGRKCGSPSDSIKVHGLSACIICHGLGDEALGRLTNCPPKVRPQQPLPLVGADCYPVNKDWDALDPFLQQEGWADGEWLHWAFRSLTASILKQDLRV